MGIVSGNRTFPGERFEIVRVVLCEQLRSVGMTILTQFEKIEASNPRIVIVVDPDARSFPPEKSARRFGDDLEP